MSKLQFPDVSGEGLTTEAVLDGAVLTVRLRGVADQGTAAAMAVATGAMNGEAVRLDVKTVVVDLRGLEFMSSSCVKSFVTWLAALQEKGSSAEYVVKFVLDQDYPWQHRTVDALRRLAPDIVSVEG